MSEYRKLYRIDEGKVFGGLCAGLGEYFNVDPIVLRLCWVLFACFAGCGIIAYLIGLLVVPKQPKTDSSSVHYQ